MAEGEPMAMEQIGESQQRHSRSTGANKTILIDYSLHYNN